MVTHNSKSDLPLGVHTTCTKKRRIGGGHGPSDSFCTNPWLTTTAALEVQPRWRSTQCMMGLSHCINLHTGWGTAQAYFVCPIYSPLRDFISLVHCIRLATLHFLRIFKLADRMRSMRTNGASKNRDWSCQILTTFSFVTLVLLFVT